MIFRSFDEWSARGFRIKKGSRSSKKRGTVNLFSEDQVWKPTEEQKKFYKFKEPISEEDRHNFIPDDWVAVDQKFSPEDEPPF